MVINWPEIGIQTAIIIALLAMAGAYLRYRVAPKLKAQAGEWAGAAIGRFWQKLMEDAEKEAGGGEAGGGGVRPGTLKLGGFEIDVGTVKELVSIAPQILQIARMFGITSGGGGGMGEHPLLK